MLSETEKWQISGEYRQFTQQIKSSGHCLAGTPLQPTLAASSVRVRSGKPLPWRDAVAFHSSRLGLIKLMRGH